MAESDEALAGLLGELAAANPDVARLETAAGVEYRVGGRPFAANEGGAAVFRLRPDVAQAAARTPGVGASPRGEGWIVLQAESVDLYTHDRAAAWFEHALRLAIEGKGDRRPN